jgi:hypothetical protein
METVRPYMGKMVFDELTKVYSNKKDAVDRAVSGFLLMRKLTLKNLKGIFNEKEKTGLVAMFNGTIIGFDLGIPPKMMLRAQVEDAVALENCDVMYGFVAADLLAKVEAMGELQAMFLLEEIHRFWNDGEVSSKDLKEFLCG